MALPKPIVTNVYAKLAALPPNLVGEIVSGTLHTHPRPSRPHAHAASSLTGEIWNIFDRRRGGPGGWVFLAEHELHLGEHVVVPDIAGWTAARYPAHEMTSFSIVAPDWLCEVTSPSTKRFDRFQKLPIYAEYGVKHCWYVDPLEQTLEVFILSDGVYTIGPGFADNAPVAAPPFMAHTFDLGILWDQAVETPDA